MKNPAKKHLRSIAVYKPGKPIEELKRELGLKEAVKLASNENALPPSSGVISSIIRAAKNLNRYPDSGSYYLKKELALRFKLKPSNFIIGNGSDEIITFAIRTFLKKGDEVIIAKPTFLIYGIAAGIENVSIKYVPLKELRYDLDAIKKAVTNKTKLIFIANPDNPTGTYTTGEEVDKFMSSLRKDVIVFFDEAYYEFAQEFNDYPKTVKFLKKDRNVIITRSFSKAYSLAGLRIGYGIACPGIIESMNKVRDPFNVNSLAQAGAMAALEDNSFLLKTRRLVKDGKKFLYNELALMGIRYVPSATNFILIDTGKRAEYIYNKLLRKGIIIRNMKAWGLNGFLRVTVGTQKENRKFIKRLSEIMRGK